MHYRLIFFAFQTLCKVTKRSQPNSAHVQHISERLTYDYMRDIINIIIHSGIILLLCIFSHTHFLSIPHPHYYFVVFVKQNGTHIYIYDIFTIIAADKGYQQNKQKSRIMNPSVPHFT